MLGREQALKILENEMDTFNLLSAVIDKEGLAEKCDYWKGSVSPILIVIQADRGAGLTYDVALDKGCAQGFRESLAAFTEDGGPAHLVKWIEAEEAKRVSPQLLDGDTLLMPSNRLLEHQELKAPLSFPHLPFGHTSLFAVCWRSVLRRV